ncbi:MAG: DUF4139 domain-containing protein [Chitinophagales bacterium]|nr:DUF4139 domain-containing protein [Bacteroidota bacterium]MCB9043127.1 DUF4139 domain-containing protein [Chitinophagales bacterium]
MKRKFLIATAFLGIQIIAFAQKPIFTKAEITAANIYRNSVELQNSASVSLPEGVSEVVIENIATNIEESSLQIGMNQNNISILSTQFSKDYYSYNQTDISSPELKSVNDSIKAIESVLTKLKIALDAQNKTVELLDKNQTLLVGSSASNVSQLTQLTDFYTQKRIAIQNEIVAINQQIEENQNKLKRLSNSVNTNRNIPNKNNVLVLKLLSKSATKLKLEINYIANNVSWEPFYEISGTKISEPLEFILKAKVIQNTGLNWKGVKLSIINGFSNKNNTAPVLYPWFLQARDRDDYAYDGGYKMEKQKARENDYMSNTFPSAAPDEDKSFQEFTINANALNVSYDINIPYDILSNNREHYINISSQKIPAEYVFFAAPNTVREAYLLAKVEDFSQYGILSAPANVIFENMFVGTTYININQTENYLPITLGSDRRISIKREDIQEKSGEKLLSAFQEKTVTYDLIVKNNKKETINIEVKDRIPLSNNEAVSVEVLEDSKATTDVEKGILQWELKLSPAESKKIRVSYKVRYPKDFVIDNL